jgi:hypothetical protein
MAEPSSKLESINLSEFDGNSKNVKAVQNVALAEAQEKQMPKLWTKAMFSVLN